MEKNQILMTVFAGLAFLVALSGFIYNIARNRRRDRESAQREDNLQLSAMHKTSYQVGVFTYAAVGIQIDYLNNSSSIIEITGVELLLRRPDMTQKLPFKVSRRLKSDRGYGVSAIASPEKPGSFIVDFAPNDVDFSTLPDNYKLEPLLATNLLLQDYHGGHFRLLVIYRDEIIETEWYPMKEPD